MKLRILCEEANVDSGRKVGDGKLIFIDKQGTYP